MITIKNQDNTFSYQYSPILLEYGYTIIYPRYEKDKKLIEGVQRRATKMVQELKDKEQPDRLKTLKLPSMRYRRYSGDMIETYKFTHGNYTSKYPLLLYQYASEVVWNCKFQSD